MMNIFLFLSIAFLLSFLLGRLLERTKIPWIFGALIIGSVLSVYNPFESITSSDTFIFLANLGVYFLLFMIGFEIDIKKLKGNSKFILKSSFFIILFEAFFGSIAIYTLFGYDWFISIIVALSFATVGEAILLPILDEFGIVNTKLGQSIIGIGTLDDIIEISTLILVTFAIGSGAETKINIWVIIISLFVMFFLSFGLNKLKEERKQFNVLDIEDLFLFIMFIFFLFLGIGELAIAAPMGALLAGIGLKTFTPPKRLHYIESEIKTLSYGLFAPIFFLWVGLTMDMKYLITYPLLIIIVILVSGGAKLLGSYLIGKNEIGKKESTLLGIGLSVRFSTSIIIIKILFENNIIGNELYSVIIASSIIFSFIIPLFFSKLILKWNLGKK